MKIPAKQLDSGFKIPAYGLGTWMMGGAVDRDLENDDAADIRAIEIAIEHGVSLIDTAEKYAAGHCEQLVGRAIARFDRSSLFLTTKVSAEHTSSADLKVAAEASLRRLQTEYIDLYLIHAFNFTVPLQETMAAMDDLVDRGLVRHIGVSNFGVENLKAAQATAKHQVVVNQVHYNLRIREIESVGLLDYCQNNDVFVMAYRPLEKGSLPSQGESVLHKLCEKYSKTPTQVTLNWLISQRNVITLSKTKEEKHLLENLGALDWTMTDDDVEWLRSSFPNQLDESDAVPLDGRSKNHR